MNIREMNLLCSSKIHLANTLTQQSKKAALAYKKKDNTANAVHTTAHTLSVAVLKHEICVEC